MRRFSVVIGLSLCLQLAAVPASAEIYKWVDDQGNVHYGDQPGAEGSEQVNMPAATSTPGEKRSDAERRDYQQRLLHSMGEERRQKEQAEAKQREESAEKQRSCEKAQRLLQQTRNAGYLYRKNEQGEREIFSDQQRQEAEAQAQAQVKKYCK